MPIVAADLIVWRLSVAEMSTTVRKAERCSSARQSVFDRKVGHEFCIHHESMARRFRPNRALPSSDVKAFNDALLLLPKNKIHASRKKHASGNSGGTGFVTGEVIDDFAPANGCPDDDYGGLNNYVDTGPSYPYASPPDEGGNSQGDSALHAEQDASSSAANDAVDTLAQYFDPDTLADGRLDADNFQGYIIPGEEYTVVCGIFGNPPPGEEQSQGLEQVAGDAFRDHGAYEV
ncbi:hypothetical protein B0H67DRAFT_550778 [Lasiosphaeris hirsuta]|uniref:Uncharacterized protein n=1 Tax=Lasiosphaeris hirsuta TaxID=260670 RepID=A0AA40B020_9PEZI|nr:hypothetical protein B0H67DRAFT_550778 [Lasiosphaeris hirsuta]